MYVCMVSACVVYVCECVCMYLQACTCVWLVLVYGCAPCVHVCTWDDGHVNVQYVIECVYIQIFSNVEKNYIMSDSPNNVMRLMTIIYDNNIHNHINFIIWLVFVLFV